VSNPRGAQRVNIDIAHDGTKHEFHIGVLIVFGADLKSRLEPRAPTGFRDVSGQESRDLVVPVDTVSRTAGVRERMPGSSTSNLKRVKASFEDEVCMYIYRDIYQVRAASRYVFEIMFVYNKMYNEVQSSVIYSLGEFCGCQGADLAY
jgi:hypothetical protein